MLIIKIMVQDRKCKNIIIFAFESREFKKNLQAFVYFNIFSQSSRMQCIYIHIYMSKQLNSQIIITHLILKCCTIYCCHLLIKLKNYRHYKNQAQFRYTCLNTYNFIEFHSKSRLFYYSPPDSCQVIIIFEWRLSIINVTQDIWLKFMLSIFKYDH